MNLSEQEVYSLRVRHARDEVAAGGAARGRREVLPEVFHDAHTLRDLPACITFPPVLATTVGVWPSVFRLRTTVIDQLCVFVWLVPGAWAMLCL